MTSNCESGSRKELLYDELSQLVKQCQIRFVNKYELATELEQVVQDLCSCIERILLHGFKKQPKTAVKSKILSVIKSSKNERETHFWNFVSLFLAEHEVKRFLSLRNVNSDFGRGRSWIRNALNEHSLEKYFLIILEDKQNLRKQFYSEWAIILDNDSSRLLQMIRSLNSILFALNIDNVDLDVNPISYQNNEEGSQNELEKLAPVKRSDNCSILVKTNQQSNMVVINDNDNVTISDDIYATSAPVTSFLNSSNSRLTARQDDLGINSNLLDNNSSSTFSINDNVNLVLYPVYCEDKESTGSIASNHTIHSIDSLKEKINSLEFERDKLMKENNLLNIQLKKYIAAIELLKYNKKEEDSSKEEDRTIDKTVYSYNDIKSYEQKLVQVSEMHGELVEFNEHLYKVIQLKDSVISRLRDELIELRGPLPDSDEILSISSDAETNSHSIQSIPQPLIHIWIPTAFLSGGFKGKSHHIYQIYIRIKEEEWNVYRRYSQFYSLHRSFKEKYPCISQFEFPPKKAIGNKDSRVVQERRKKLEFYLRNLINYIQSQNPDMINKEKLISIIPFLSDKFFMQDRSQSDTNLNNTQPQQSTSQHYMGF